MAEILPHSTRPSAAYQLNLPRNCTRHCVRLKKTGVPDNLAFALEPETAA